MTQTLNDIRLRGLEALVRELGQDGMLRFMQQFEAGKGDYAVERRQWVDSTSMEDIRAMSRIGKRRKKSK